MSKAIVNIKKTSFEYEKIEEFKAGVMLEGWMVKSIRAGHVSASDGVYAHIQNGEVFLLGLNVKRMDTTCTHKKINEQPSIKLLLNRKEISRIIGSINQKGYTLVLRNLFWEKNLVKANLWLAKGKTLHDKRKTIKDRVVKKEMDRAMKNAQKNY